MTLPVPHYAATVLAGSGMRSYIDGSASTAGFMAPIACDLSPDGSILYVADHAAGAIRTVDTATGAVGTLWTNGGNGVLDVTVAYNTGNVWAVAADNATLNNWTGTIKKISPSGAVLGSYASQPMMKGVGVSNDETLVFAAYGVIAGGWGHGHLCNGLTGADIFVDGNFTMAGACAVDDDGNVWHSSVDFADLRRFSPAGVQLVDYINGDSHGLKMIRNSGGWFMNVDRDGSITAHMPALDFHQRPYSGSSVFDGTRWDPAQPPNIVTGLPTTAGQQMWCCAGQGTSPTSVPALLYLVTCPYVYGGVRDVMQDPGPAMGTSAGDSCKVYKLRTGGPSTGRIGI